MHKPSAQSASVVDNRANAANGAMNDVADKPINNAADKFVNDVADNAADKSANNIVDNAADKSVNNVVNKFANDGADKPANYPAYTLSTDIPKSYDDTYVRSIPRDPAQTFVYWEMPSGDAANCGIPERGNIHTHYDRATWIKDRVNAHVSQAQQAQQAQLLIPDTTLSRFDTSLSVARDDRNNICNDKNSARDASGQNVSLQNMSAQDMSVQNVSAQDTSAQNISAQKHLPLAIPPTRLSEFEQFPLANLFDNFHDHQKFANDVHGNDHNRDQSLSLLSTISNVSNANDATSASTSADVSADQKTLPIDLVQSVLKTLIAQSGQSAQQMLLLRSALAARGDAKNISVALCKKLFEAIIAEAAQNFSSVCEKSMSSTMLCNSIGKSA